VKATAAVSRWSRASILIGALLLFGGQLWSGHPAAATVEGWHPGSSWLPHAGWTSQAKAVGNVTGARWSGPLTDAISSWNGTFTSFDPFVQVGQQSGALIHVVEAGSVDEGVLDWLKPNWEGHSSQGTCAELAVMANTPYAWAAVGIYFGDEIYPHYSDYKVCIWPDRVIAGANWEYLTIKHELGHILGFGDDSDGDACLFRSGTSMTEVCFTEVNWIKGHLGRQ